VECGGSDVTESMRSKESLTINRYFPRSDLLPVMVMEPAFSRGVVAECPELRLGKGAPIWRAYESLRTMLSFLTALNRAGGLFEAVWSRAGAKAASEFGFRLTVRGD